MSELRLAIRQLIGSPGFTLLAIVTLGLGIGMNTAMFTLLHTMLLKPLPYRDAARLFSVQRVTAQDSAGNISAADFIDLRRETDRFGEIAAYLGADASLAEAGQPPEMAYACRVTTNLFSMLGVRPQLGRDFRPAEEVHGRDHVVILSHRCWQMRFGGRADVIGRIIRLDGEPHEIVGVLPESFNDWRHLGWVNFFRPLGLTDAQRDDRRTLSLRLVGRLSGRLSFAEAGRFIAHFGARLAQDYPTVDGGSSWRTRPLDNTTMARTPQLIVPMLVGLSGFVLLIACSNLANLLLARTISRAREFAVRSALGASRTQLLRPLIAESLVLALAGGACAIVVSVWVGDWISVRATPPETGVPINFALDWTIIGWAFGASLVTALAFGLAPALFALRLDLNDTLKSGGRGATGTRAQRHFRQALIVGQFALAMVLLAGAALFIRGLDELNNRRAGWKSDALATGTILLPAAAYPNPGRIAAFHDVMVERLRAIPGVADAGVSTFMPFVRWGDLRRYLVEGSDRPKPGQEPAALVNCVSPGYFDTVGTRIVSGRPFNGGDTAESGRVFIVNEAMARGLFGGRSPLVRRLAQFSDGAPQWGEIVGVAADVKSDMPDGDSVVYQLYQPMAQEPRLRTVISVRATGIAPALLLDGIRHAMAELEPDLPIRQLLTADATIHLRNYQLGVLRDLLGWFATLGLALACLGIYGIIARTMAQRTSEFAIRIALGASIRNIAALVLGSGLRLALTGAAIGVVGALALSRLLESAFTGMKLDGFSSLIAATLLLIAVALLACWLPARRAGKVDAILALRAE